MPTRQNWFEGWRLFALLSLTLAALCVGLLVAPFAPVTDSSSSSWVRRGIPTLLALVVYGFGLAFLARFMHGRA